MFINAALVRRGDPESPIPSRHLPLARRLIREEVPDCRLGTLASRFVSITGRRIAPSTMPGHDDLLHFLLERAAGLGVLASMILIALPRIGAHPQAAKLRMTAGLPRSPGVYLFRGANDQVLYVGKATNLRQRVRSYFGSDDRRKIGTLLREARRITYVTTPNVLAAEVLELRYLQQLAPGTTGSARRRRSISTFASASTKPGPRLRWSTTRRGLASTSGHSPRRPPPKTWSRLCNRLPCAGAPRGSAAHSSPDSTRSCAPLRNWA